MPLETDITLGTTGVPELDKLYQEIQPKKLDWPTFKTQIGLKDSDDVSKWEAAQSSFFFTHVAPKLSSDAAKTQLWDEFKDQTRPVKKDQGMFDKLGTLAWQTGIASAQQTLESIIKPAAAIARNLPAGFVGRGSMPGFGQPMASDVQKQVQETFVDIPRAFLGEQAKEAKTTADWQGLELSQSLAKFGGSVIGSAPAFALMGYISPLPGIFKLDAGAKFSPWNVYKDKDLYKAIVTGGVHVGTYQSVVEGDPSAFPSGFAFGGTLGAVDRLSRGWIEFLRGKFTRGPEGGPPSTWHRATVPGGPPPSSPAAPSKSTPTGQAILSTQELAVLVRQAPRGKQLALWKEYQDGLPAAGYIPGSGQLVTLSGKDAKGVDDLSITLADGKVVKFNKSLKDEDYLKQVVEMLGQGSPVKEIIGPARFQTRYLQALEDIHKPKLPLSFTAPDARQAKNVIDTLAEQGIRADLDGTSIFIHPEDVHKINTTVAKTIPDTKLLEDIAKQNKRILAKSKELPFGKDIVDLDQAKQKTADLVAETEIAVKNLKAATEPKTSVEKTLEQTKKLLNLAPREATPQEVAVDRFEPTEIAGKVYYKDKQTKEMYSSIEAAQMAIKIEESSGAKAREVYNKETSTKPVNNIALAKKQLEEDAAKLLVTPREPKTVTLMLKPTKAAQAAVPAHPEPAAPVTSVPVSVTTTPSTEPSWVTEMRQQIVSDLDKEFSRVRYAEDLATKEAQLGEPKVGSPLPDRDKIVASYQELKNATQSGKIPAAQMPGAMSRLSQQEQFLRDYLSTEELTKIGIGPKVELPQKSFGASPEETKQLSQHVLLGGWNLTPAQQDKLAKERSAAVAMAGAAPESLEVLQSSDELQDELLAGLTPKNQMFMESASKGKLSVYETYIDESGATKQRIISFKSGPRLEVMDDISRRGMLGQLFYSGVPLELFSSSKDSPKDSEGYLSRALKPDAKIDYTQITKSYVGFWSKGDRTEVMEREGQYGVEHYEWANMLSDSNEPITDLQRKGWVRAFLMLNRIYSANGPDLSSKEITLSIDVSGDPKVWVPSVRSFLRRFEPFVDVVNVDYLTARDAKQAADIETEVKTFKFTSTKDLARFLENPDTYKSPKAGLEVMDAVSRKHPGLYSPLKKFIEAKTNKYANRPDDLVRKLSIGGDIRKLELETTGIIEWLKTLDRPVSQEELLKYFKEHQIVLKDVTKSSSLALDSQKTQDEEEIARLQVELDTTSASISSVLRSIYPEGTSISELAETFTWEVGSRPADIRKALAEDRLQDVSDSTITQLSDMLDFHHRTNNKIIELQEGYDTNGLGTKDGAIYGGSGLNLPGGDPGSYKEVLITLKQPKPPFAYSSSHWLKDKNVLVHTRFDTVTDPNSNKKTLRIQEVQSDLHQAARKATEQVATQRAERRFEVEAELKRTDPLWHSRLKDPHYKQIYKEELKKAEEEHAGYELDIYRADSAAGRLVDSIPDVPYKEISEYTGLALKKLLLYAAEHNFDSIGWTTGAQQSKRYGKLLEQIKVKEAPKERGSQVVIGISMGEGISATNYQTRESLLGLVGNDEDLASQIWNTPAGQTLKLDKPFADKGMTYAYDKIITDVFKKLGRQYNLDVQLRSPAKHKLAMGPFESPEIWMFDIPTAWKQDIMTHGLPIASTRRQLVLDSSSYDSSEQELNLKLKTFGEGPSQAQISSGSGTLEEVQKAHELLIGEPAHPGVVGWSASNPYYHPVQVAVRGIGKRVAYHEVSHTLLSLNPHVRRAIRDFKQSPVGMIPSLKDTLDDKGLGPSMAKMVGALVGWEGTTYAGKVGISIEDVLARLWSSTRAIGYPNDLEARDELTWLAKLDTDLPHIINIAKESAKWVMKLLPLQDNGVATSLLEKAISKVYTRTSSWKGIQDIGRVIANTADLQFYGDHWQMLDLDTGKSLSFKTLDSVLQWALGRIPGALAPIILSKTEQEARFNGLRLWNPIEPGNGPGPLRGSGQIMPSITRREFLDIARPKRTTKRREKPEAADPGSTLLTAYFRPTGPWMQSVEEQTMVPVMQKIWIPFDNGVRLSEVALRPIFRWIDKTAETVPPEKRKAYSAYMITSSLEAKTEIAVLNWFNEQDFGNLKEAREIYDKFFVDFDIGDYAKYVQDYLPRILAYRRYKEAKDKANWKDIPLNPWKQLHKMPGKIDFFAQHERIKDEIEDSALEEDFFVQMWSYAKMGARKKYLGPAWQEGLKVYRDPRLSNELRVPIANYMRFMYSQPDPTYGAIQHAWETIIKSIPFIGKVLTEKDINKIVLLQYASGLGFRPSLVVRDALQGFLTGYPRLGEYWFARGLTATFDVDKWERAKKYQALIEDPMMPAFEVDPTTFDWQDKLSEISRDSLKFTQWGNNIARNVIFNGAYERALPAVAKFRADRKLDNFVQDTGLETVLQGYVPDLTLRALDPSTPIEDIAGEIGRLITEDSQWNFRRGTSAAPLHTKLGRILGMYYPWPMNFVEYMKRGISQGSIETRRNWFARWAAANTVSQLSSLAVGVDTYQWIWAQPGEYNLSPFANAIMDLWLVPRAALGGIAGASIAEGMGQSTTVGALVGAGAMTALPMGNRMEKEARLELLAMPMQFVPGWTQMKNMIKSLDSPNPILGMLGFKPLEDKSKLRKKY